MMKAALQTSLGCLFIALALNVALTHAQLLTPESAFDLPWLQIRTTAGQDRTMRPESTTIYTSVPPLVRQVSGNRWQITFNRK
jgi:hypothetical protein